MISLLKYEENSHDFIGDKVSTALAVICLIQLLASTIFITHAAIKVHQTYKAEEDEIEESRYFSLFEDVRIDKQSALFNNVLFMIRRLTLVGILTLGVRKLLW